MNITEELSKCGLSLNDYEECIGTILDKKNNKNDIDWQEICDKYNLDISPDNLRRVNSTIFGGAFIAEYFKDKCNHDTAVENTVENVKNQYGTKTTINKDGTFSSNKLLKMTDEESRNPEYLLKAHGFDPCYWKIVNARNNERQVVDKQNHIVTLYASFLTVKPLTSSEVPLYKYEEFFEKLSKNYTIPKLNKNYRYLAGNKLLLLDIADLHMNLQASIFTTRNEYNCDIAEKLFFHTISDILTRTKEYCFDEIVFCIGGDMLNGDNLFGFTTKGTPQDSDIHFYDAYERLCNITVKAIDMLREYCNKIKVVYVMGNHDEVSSFKLAKYIDAWFRNCNDVEVDYQPVARKYVVFGKTLLCFAHDGNVKQLPSIVANEARQYWSQVDTVEVFLQHLHTEQVLMEDNNIRIQRLPTISGKSKWSSDKGFNSKRQCKTFIFDKEDGLTDILYTPIKDI